MLRKAHSLPGLVAAILVALLAATGAILALDPIMERAESAVPPPGQLDVARLATMAVASRADVERIVKTPSGSIIVYAFVDGRPRAERIDPLTGQTIAPHQPSQFTKIVTSLHRSLLLGDGGRAAVGLGALAMVVLTITGAMMLAARLGGWRALLRPIRGPGVQRLHLEIARFAVVGLVLTGVTGCYMSLATFGFVPDGAAREAPASVETSGGRRLAVGSLNALQSVDVNVLRELTFPYASDATDVYTLTTAFGVGRIDAATGEVLQAEPHDLARRIYETIYMLHTGQGLWQLAILLGLTALSVPLLAISGTAIWWRRKAARPRIRGNRSAQEADIIILVGSEGNATWRFAATLHAGLTAAGHTVHVAQMNAVAQRYKRAERLLVLTSTYGDGQAPASANRFLERIQLCKLPLPVAVLGFGDRSYPDFCRFADQVAAALAAKGWPLMLPLTRIDRGSAQDFARWGTVLGAALGHTLQLDHVAARPSTIAFTLVERADYGIEVQAPTSILRFIVPGGSRRPSLLQRWLGRAQQLPRFEAGDLVGILPPNSTIARFYSLASSTRDGVLEICVRKQPGGLCSSFLHELKIGDRIEAFIQPNPNFRPARSKAPLILIGAGAGIGPLVGIIRGNLARRPVYLYWGGRDPASDFLYEGELAFYLSDQRVRRRVNAFSRVARGCYVQDRIADEANVMRDLIRRGAQVMVCGGRDMASSVATVTDGLLIPLGIDLDRLKAEGRYVEDVY